MEHVHRYITGFTRAVSILILLLGILTGLKTGKTQAVTAPPASTAPQGQWSDADLQGPQGSGAFGLVYPLPNGNLVVVDSTYTEGNVSQVGAVYLYDSTHSLIQRLTGSQANDQVGYYGVRVLPNGYYLVLSPFWDDGSAADAGAVTWCNGSTGCNGDVVSASNSLIGSANDQIGGSIKILASGNYVVINYGWDNGPAIAAGAVTWCSAASGCFGQPNPENSLVGTHSMSRVGSTVTLLADGDYVVQSPFWYNDNNLSVGAVTWCSGAMGCKGSVSSANSLVGSQAGDAVGATVVGLSSGTYAVISPSWANGAAKSAGAVTWCPDIGGCSGIVSPMNSLIGSQTNDKVGKVGDFIGVVPLSNGNYVVGSDQWANGSLVSAGAVTWCKGDGSCVGAILTNQSLVGIQANDSVGNDVIQGLTNGNYVVSNTVIRNARRYLVASFCDGNTGCNGPIDLTKSLTYLYPESNIGSSPMTITPLEDGNYVVITESWWNGSAYGAGAVTWCSGQAGCIGEVTASNSLVGSQIDDWVGDKVYALAGGSYVVDSQSWANGANRYAGAVTFCKGSPGCTGTISAQNSLVGEHDFDGIGRNLVVLGNHNYVVSSSGWRNGSSVNVGQATWCSGETGCIGTVLSNRSLIGSQASAFVGSDPVVALRNGNYVVKSYAWKNGSVISAGAATWCPGDTGCDGVVSAQNSLVGTQAKDYIGDNVTALTNGNYLMIHMGWSNGSTTASGAVTLGAGNTPTPIGPISTANSILGTLPNGGRYLNAAFDRINGLLVVGKPNENRVSFLSIPSTSIASGAWDDPKTWDYGVPAPNGEAIISVGHTVTISGSATARKVTIQSGATLALANGSSLAVRGEFNNQGGFKGPNGTMILAGPGEHWLNANGPTAFGNLIIQSGAVLVEQPAADFFTVQGRLDNLGVIRKAQSVSGAGWLSFGLTGAAVQIVNPGGLTQLQVDRTDQDYPIAMEWANRYKLLPGTFWSLSTTTQDTSPYMASLYLPHTLAAENTKAGICHYSDLSWSCGRSGSDNAIVRQDGISQLVGDWMIGQELNEAQIQLNDLNQIYDGAPKAAQVITNPPMLAFNIMYVGVNGTVYGPTEQPPVNAGSYSVQVTINDANYMGSAAAPLTISKASQTIDFGALSGKAYGDTEFSVRASASSGLPVGFSVGSQDACAISGSTVRLTRAGNCTITAEQTGDTNYKPAEPVSQTFTIAKANAAIHITGLDQSYDGSPKPVTVTTIPNGLSFAVTYQSETYGPATEPPSASGSYEVHVQINDANYQGEAKEILVIGKARIYLPFLAK